MMARAVVLEDFDRPQQVPQPVAMTPVGGSPEVTAEQLEEAKLKSYEAGYSAGWEDAAAAYDKEQARIGADLAHHIEDLSFTYHEAHAALQREMAEVLRGLLDKVLAPSVPAALGAMIESRVAEVSAASRVAIEIAVAPENVERLEPLAESASGVPLRFLAEPTLGPGQAFLRFGSVEEQIDIDAVLAEMAEAIDQHFTVQSQQHPDSAGREVGHG